MRWPFVSLAALDAANARADAEHENAQYLRREMVTMSERWAVEFKAERQRHDETRTWLYEVTGTVSGIAERMTTKPTTQQTAAPEFKQFPPLVASALAVATAGFKKDAQREIYEWAASALVTQSEKEVADVLRTGLPMRIEPDELS